jgi:hypothetical protein
VRVEAVQRHGRNEEDALVLSFSNGQSIRCKEQKRLHTPKGWQTFFAGETDGLCQPAYLTNPEVGDAWIGLCRLASVSAQQDELDELTERLAGFVDMTEIMHRSLTNTYRYSTLRAIQGRSEYDKLAALEGKHGRHTVRPVLVADHEWGEVGTTVYFIRHSEFICHLRHVYSLTVSDNFLKGRMAELDCEYHMLQARGPSRRSRPHLNMYELANTMPVPLNTADG